MSEYDLFIEAFQRSDRSERAAYLDQACAGDAALRQRVEILLKADDDASAVLQEPAPTGSPALEAKPGATLPLTQCLGVASTIREDRVSSADPAGALLLSEDPGVPRPRETELASAPDLAARQTLTSPDDQQEKTDDAGEPESASGGETKLLPSEEPFDPSGSHEWSRSSPFGNSEAAGLVQFELLAELGRGGMGVVYKARHRHLNRIVALKMISDGKHAHPEHRARFLIEAEAVARLSHPNIVQIYDFGEAEGSPFVTLELLEGGSLADRLKGTTQPGRVAAELVETRATAMHAAHQAGIVHRDLKPANVLFDRDATPKITDFGLAKRLEVDEGQTRMGQIMGTPSYMAPEQAQGDVRQIGPPADIYALGAVLYEMLTGRPPFKGSSTMETLHQVVYDEVVPPSRIETRIARDLETVCLKCLQKEPPTRYGTALELADDLRRFRNHQPIRARRTPLWERGAKWVRRHPTATTLIGLAGAAAVALVMAYGNYEARIKARTQAAEDQANQQRAKTEKDLETVQDSLLGKHWGEGKFTLVRVLTELGTDRRYADLKGRASRMVERADRGLREEADQSRDREQQRLFVQRRNLAFVRETGYTGIELTNDVAATRTAAVAALAVFADAGPGDCRARSRPRNRPRSGTGAISSS